MGESLRGARGHCDLTQELTGTSLANSGLELTLDLALGTDRVYGDSKLSSKTLLAPSMEAGSTETRLSDLYVGYERCVFLQLFFDRFLSI